MTDPTISRSVMRDRDEEQNRIVQRKMQSRISYFVDHPEDIERRLVELEREWTVERLMEASAASLGFAGAFLGATKSRKWLALPVVVSGFLLQQAVQGWSPPYPALRRLGFRTRREIEQERYALMALRGDFDGLSSIGNKLSAIFRIIGIEPR